MITEIRFSQKFKRSVGKECWNVEWFSPLEEARNELTKFCEHYNQQRAHGALADWAPEAFMAL